MFPSDLFANILFVLAVIAVLFLLVFFGVSKRDKSKKITMNAVVRDIRGEMKGSGNPIWSRSGPMYIATETTYAEFELSGGEIVKFKVPKRLVKKLYPGMRGKLALKNGKLIAFVVDRT